MQVFSLLHSSTPNHREHVDVSTSYVDRLQSYSSPSSSIAPSPRDESPVDLECATALPKFTDAEHSNPERTPLIGTTDSHHTLSDVHHGPDSSYGAVHHTHDHVDGNASEFFESHHRHESRSLHLSHHERSRPTTMYGPAEFAPGRPGGAGHVQHSESDHHHHHGFEDTENFTDTHEHYHLHQQHHLRGHERKVKVGKKRQIVGILVRLTLDSLTRSPLTPVKVLQLGIMIHSLIIGLTLSITSGPDFSASLSVFPPVLCLNDDRAATLLIAVIFHQLFEGLSLGIRIASLPSSQEQEFKYLSMLKPTLACLFGITAPAGIVLGILVFEHNDDMGTSRAPLHLRFESG